MQDELFSFRRISVSLFNAYVEIRRKDRCMPQSSTLVYPRRSIFICSIMSPSRAPDQQALLRGHSHVTRPAQ